MAAAAAAAAASREYVPAGQRTETAAGPSQSGAAGQARQTVAARPE